MSSVREFLRLVAEPAIEITKKTNNSIAVSVNEYSDEEVFRDSIHAHYAKATKELTKTIGKMTSDTDAITYVIEVISRIEKVLSYYSIRDISEGDGKEAMVIRTTVCGNASWCHDGDFTRGSSNPDDLLEVDRFTKILFEYGQRFHEHILVLEKRLPTITKLLISNSRLSSVLPRYHWKRKKVEFKELIWCLVESKFVTKDAEGKEKVSRIELARVLGTMLGMKWENIDQELNNAKSRSGKKDSVGIKRRGKDFQLLIDMNQVYRESFALEN